VFIVNTPHDARKKWKLEYDDVAQWNPRLIYADLTGSEKGPDAAFQGSISQLLARSGLLFMTRDAGEPPTWPWPVAAIMRLRSPCMRNRDRSLSSRTHWQRILRHDFAPRGRCLVGNVFIRPLSRCEFLWATRSGTSRQMQV